jgi:nucleotide-binding universal stress UspA family protein
MAETERRSTVLDIICPSDLSERSQRALGFATRLAETLGSRLTACHCALANWFARENRLPKPEHARIIELLEDEIRRCETTPGGVTRRSLVVENSFDPSRDILSLARETAADLIVMKARPGVLSAFRFGSIVERVIEGAGCPVMLLPSRFLAEHDPQTEPLAFRNILFDYDFSDATDQLFGVVSSLTQSFHSGLSMLSVLEPPGRVRPEAAPLPRGRLSMQRMIRGRLDEVVRGDGALSTLDVPTVVESGPHAETVLHYAADHDIDLICTALPPPHFYFEKLYRGYLGELLRIAACPILVKQSVGSKRIKDL